MKEPMSIEKIAEELGVNFYDLRPLIEVRENWLIERAKQEGIKEAELQTTALAPLLQSAYMQGIKEVVEWVNQNYKGIVDGWEGKNKLVGLDIDPEQWQAQLKEWGIKDETKVS